MRDDGRGVAHRGRVRARRLDLVPGDGHGLLRPEDGRVRAEGMGARCSRRCRASTPCSFPAATPATRRPKVLFDLLEKQTANLKKYHPKAADVDVAAELHRAVDGGVLRTRSARNPRVAGGHRVRPADARSAAETASDVPEKIPDPRLPGHHPQPPVPVPGARLGRGVRAHRGPRGVEPAADANGQHVPLRPRTARSASSPTPRAATTT